MSLLKLFTFQTEEEYDKARSTGYIESYDIMRVKVYHSPEGTGYHDFPVHSQEEFDKLTERLNSTGQKFETYRHKHAYSGADYYDHD